MLRSAGFELMGFTAILVIVGATVGLGTSVGHTRGALGAQQSNAGEASPVAAAIDTDTTRHTQARTPKTTQGGGARLSKDSLAKNRDGAAHAGHKQADTIKSHAAPPPSAVVP